MVYGDHIYKSQRVDCKNKGNSIYPTWDKVQEDINFIGSADSGDYGVYDTLKYYCEVGNLEYFELILNGNNSINKPYYISMYIVLNQYKPINCLRILEHFLAKYVLDVQNMAPNIFENLATHHRDFVMKFVEEYNINNLEACVKHALNFCRDFNKFKFLLDNFKCILSPYKWAVYSGMKHRVDSKIFRILQYLITQIDFEPSSDTITYDSMCDSVKAYPLEHILCEYCINANLEQFTEFLSKYPNINIHFKYDLPFKCAVEYDNEPIIKYFRCFDNICFNDPRSYLPYNIFGHSMHVLVCAVRTGNVELIKYLLETYPSISDNICSTLSSLEWHTSCHLNSDTLIFLSNKFPQLNIQQNIDIYIKQARTSKNNNLANELQDKFHY